MSAAILRLPTKPNTMPRRGNQCRSQPFQGFQFPSKEKTAVRINDGPRIRRKLDSPIMAAVQNRSKESISQSRVLVMEEVKILKRGVAMPPLSSLSSVIGRMENIPMSLTDLLGPEPNTLPKTSASAFAGSAFITSPSPSSLPVPFFLKKAVSTGDDVAPGSLMSLL
ncbi:hypothetical protein KSP39_PZI002359 [Platanthera zijinensis]|uniref:Uncharacterized protein n=1 Tax=Platanthera zijinensis TaxID=2320716 RepID=A0AAP0C1K4_9ASPA